MPSTPENKKISYEEQLRAFFLDLSNLIQRYQCEFDLRNIALITGIEMVKNGLIEIEKEAILREQKKRRQRKQK